MIEIVHKCKDCAELYVFKLKDDGQERQFQCDCGAFMAIRQNGTVKHLFNPKREL